MVTKVNICELLHAEDLRDAFSEFPGSANMHFFAEMLLYDCIEDVYDFSLLLQNNCVLQVGCLQPIIGRGNIEEWLANIFSSFCRIKQRIIKVFKDTQDEIIYSGDIVCYPRKVAYAITLSYMAHLILVDNKAGNFRLYLDLTPLKQHVINLNSII